MIISLITAEPTKVRPILTKYNKICCPYFNILEKKECFKMIWHIFDAKKKSLWNYFFSLFLNALLLGPLRTSTVFTYSATEQFI